MDLSHLGEFFDADPASQNVGARWALVIGNSYDTPPHDSAGWPSIRSARVDAENMVHEFQSKNFNIVGGGAQINVNRAKFIELLNILEKLIGNTQNSIAIVYYAGHGFQFNGRNYLVPVDAPAAMQSDHDPTKFVSLHEIYAHIARAKPFAALLLLDACRSTGILYPQDESIDPVPDRTFVGFAADSGGTALGYKSGPTSGLYTSALTEALHNGLALEDLREVHLRAAMRVIQETGFAQRPAYVVGAHFPRVSISLRADTTDGPYSDSVRQLVDDAITSARCADPAAAGFFGDTMNEADCRAALARLQLNPTASRIRPKSGFDSAAAAILLEATENGDRRAEFFLGMLEAFGWSPDPDTRGKPLGRSQDAVAGRAEGWQKITNAADHGYRPAMLVAGLAYTFSDDQVARYRFPFPRNIARGIGYLDAAYRAGVGRAGYILSVLFSNGRYIPKNDQKTRYYLRGTAATGLQSLPRDEQNDILISAGQDSMLGVHGPRDPSLAAGYFNRVVTTQPEDPVADRAIGKSSKGMAASYLGLLLLDDPEKDPIFQGLAPNDTLALAYLRFAAERGNSLGEIQLGFFASRGLHGVQQNKSEAIRWYKLAADQGVDLAREQLRVLGAEH